MILPQADAVRSRPHVNVESRHSITFGGAQLFLYRLESVQHQCC